MLACLTIMCVTALPAVRRRYHDLFEHTHRFLGWSALLLLWANVLLTANDSPQAGAVGPLAAMPTNASFWLTVAITALVLSPWLTVRKVQVQARVLSRAVVEITFPDGSEPGTFGRISRHPLADWHAFALLAGTRGAVSHSMVISGLGDFTKGLIITPPAALYVRTVKFPGLPCCVPMYRRSIIIATGAGMVPYLSLLTTLPRGSHRLIWIGRSFRECFGSNLCDFVLQWPDVVLVDTTSGARPDMTALAVAHYCSFEADVVYLSGATRRALAKSCPAAADWAFRRSGQVGIPSRRADGSLAAVTLALFAKRAKDPQSWRLRPPSLCAWKWNWRSARLPKYF